MDVVELITRAGDFGLLAGICGTMAIITLFKRRYRVAAAFTGTIGLMLFYHLLKDLFNQPRPDTIYASTLTTGSFPSGHAADSAATYGLIGYLLYHNGKKALGITVGAVPPFLIGWSRIILGAHFPVDVIAGWLIAGLGLFTLVRFLKLKPTPLQL